MNVRLNVIVLPRGEFSDKKKKKNSFKKKILKGIMQQQLLHEARLIAVL